MHVAVTWLQEEDAPLGEIGRRLGYESEAAFGRTFKRFLGFPPGAVRRTSGSSEGATTLRN
jgi:AraC-like DNA-binding protein